MSAKPEITMAEIGVRLLDDAYLAWWGAADESSRALRIWFDSAPRNRAATYWSYRAALDREAAAADDLERLSELAQPCLVATREASLPRRSPESNKPHLERHRRTCGSDGGAAL